MREVVKGMSGDFMKPNLTVGLGIGNRGREGGKEGRERGEKGRDREFGNVKRCVCECVRACVLEVY